MAYISVDTDVGCNAISTSLINCILDTKMEKRQFRFRKEYFSINGIYNIPGLIISTGHGYDFKTYCCKNCGEIFVADLGAFRFQQIDLNTICKGKACPNCNDILENCLVKYPENIFYNGGILKNSNSISPLSSNEIDELIEAFVFS